MEKKTITGITLTLLLISMLILAFDIQQVKPELKTRGSEKSSIDNLQFTHSGTKQGKKGNEEQARIVEHRITVLEMEKLKREIGVWEEGRNYNQIVNGHGTGLRPPTEEEWEKIADHTYVVERILLENTFQSPSSVDHTNHPSFPPIGNQDGEGSCTAWAVGYYMKTFHEAKEHGWDLTGAQWLGGYYGYPTPAYQDRIFSPDFIYHLINGGVDGGSSFYDAINLVCSIGASTWQKMPYGPDDSSSWPSEDAWREAPLYRGNSSSYEFLWLGTDNDLASLKSWVASGHLALISVDADKYSQLTSTDFWTLDNYVTPSRNHANTIVGYDDNIEYTEEGQLRHGAFKIANSWGEGGWENIPDGCYWISYEAMKQRVSYCRFYRDIIGYNPELVSLFRVDHSKRGECSISIGMGNSSNPNVTKSFSQFVWGGDQPFCPNDILFDITEFKNVMPTVYNQSFFLKVSDYGTLTTGTISKFAVEYIQSPDTPVNTVQGSHVYAEVLLFPLETRWIPEKLVSLDEDFIDNTISMATDSNGYLYIAYADWYPAVNQQAIFVRRSTDGGNTWSIIMIGYDPTHNLQYPSIATNPYSNDIFVAVEREWTSSDHDILVLRYVNATWSWRSVANVLGSDDRFPSITSEYSYGEANWQYISYEYVYSYNDRDLMFAKSTDHGTNWSIKKLHGNWPDYNVHTQTCIANAEGNIYIAYKWGADYDSPSEIRVERSTDLGSTWTRFTDIDGLPNSCSFPSIAASHGGSTVMVAFQYDWSANDIDIWYSYSVDKGTIWTKGKPLFISSLEDETLPILAVDGGGRTGDNIRGHFHAVCKSNYYMRYRKAHHSNPFEWSSPEFVNERWAGKGLAVITEFKSDIGEFYPCIAWTDEKTRNLYYSTLIPRTWTVDDDGPADFSSIQEAINSLNVNPGDTIFVHNGIYYEHVIANKTVSLIGEDPKTTIIDGSGTGAVISLPGFDLSPHIEGFTIQNSDTGIYGLYSGSFYNPSNITNINIRWNRLGVMLLRSRSFVTNVSAYDNEETGFYFSDSYVDLIDCSATSNNGTGFSVGYGTVFYTNCTAFSNGGNGFSIGMRASARLLNCNSSLNIGNGYDSYVYSIMNVENSTASYNGQAGFYVYNGGIGGARIESSNSTNNQYGISIISSTSVNLTRNRFSNNTFNVRLSGDGLSQYFYDYIYIDSSNTVNGKPIYYLKDQHDIIVDSSTFPDVGYLGIVSSTNVTVKDLTLTKNHEGILFAYTNASTIENVLSSDNVLGIALYGSINNTIMNNTITSNSDAGIYLYDSINNNVVDNLITNNSRGINVAYGSLNNTIIENTISENNCGIEIDDGITGNIAYHNNIINNTEQVLEMGTNLWDNGYEGNFWSDYNGTDTNADGIGDTYLPWNEVDHYPLMNAYLGHNIAITNIEMNKTIVGRGSIQKIDVEVVNLGSFPQTFSVTAYVNTTVTQTQMMTLAAGNSTILRFYWDTTDFDYGNYIISAIADTIPGETDMTDNTYTDGTVLLTIAGDIDGDGDVDPDDFFIFSGTYGSSVGDPWYNPEADLDGDGDVDPDDFFIFSGNYGSSI